METYLVRESARSKHVRLEFSLEQGLVVVVPVGFDRSEISAILEAKRAWVERAQRRARADGKDFPRARTGELPERIALRAIEEEWAVDYRSASTPWVAAKPLAVPTRCLGRLEVAGGIEDPAACGAALRRWIRRKARAHLVPWLERVSGETGLSYGQSVVRNPRTRWGSYSRQETISLNQNLLFLPSRLVRYVLLHELCHSVHLEHSSQFWRLVREKEPRAQALREELRLAWRYVPGWTSGTPARVAAGEPAHLPWSV